MKKVLLASVAIAALSTIAFAQNGNVGIGTNNPQTKLQVEGGISASPATAAAAATVSIPNNTSVFRLSTATGVQANALSMTAPNEGQYLTIYNTDDNDATFAGQTIAANTGVASFNYVNGGWRMVSNTKAGGDLSGTFPNPTVNKIQGKPVSNATPNDGDVLKYNNTTGQYEPSPDVSGGGSGTVTGSNGVSSTGGTTPDIKLGGTPLTAATNVPLNGQVLTFSGNTGSVGIGSATAPARLYVQGDVSNPIFAAVDNTAVAKLYVDNTGKVGVNTNAPNTSLDVRTTDAIQIPVGTTIQRPASPSAGFTRFNTDSKAFEYYDGTQWVSANVAQVPIGTITSYGGNTPPTGWLICNGSAVSRTTYAELFAAIGTAYGAGDGSTTFNLPDMRGRTAFGLSASAPFNTLGSIGGATSVTPSLSPSLSVDIAAFNAALPVHTHSLPAHFHGIGTGAGLNTTAATSGTPSTNSTSSNGTHTHTISGTTGNAGSHSHNIWAAVHDVNSASSQGYPAGNVHNTVRSSDRGRSNTVGAMDASGDHNHSFSGTTSNTGGHTHDLGNHSHSIPSVAVTGNIGLVTGGVNGNAAMTSGSSSAADVSIDPPATAITGSVSSSAINTTNPYQVLNYIIKATTSGTASVVAPNISTGTFGQTLYSNGSTYTPTSNLYNNGANVGIGNTSPAALLAVGSSSQLQINSAGDLRTSGTVTLSALNTNGLVRTTGTNGVLSIGQASNADISDVAWSKVTGAPSFISGNITLSGDVAGTGTNSITTTLANSGVGAGTYRSVTVDAKGRVTAGTNPTTLAGYGITDAAPASGSGNYIQSLGVDNNFGAGQAASFDITGNGEIGGSLDVNGRFGVGTTGPGYPVHMVGTSGDGVPAVMIESSAAATTWNTPLQVMMPNIQAGGKNMLALGKQYAAGRNGYMYYYHAGDGNVGNSLRFGFYGIDDIMNITSEARVGIGTTAPNPHKLNVFQSGIAGTGYATSTANAVYGNGAGASYSFGVTGYCNGSPQRGGGVHGAYSSATWGALGYYTSGSAAIGGYFASSTANGAGYLPQGNAMAGVATGAYGDFIGSWTRGNVFGHIASGELAAGYNVGNVYTSGHNVEIVKNGEQRLAAYSNTSPEATVSKAGKAQLVNGKAVVTFDANFAAMLSADEEPIITVTPIGNCNGIHLVRTGKNSFEVEENNGGNSSVSFTYIVMGKRVDAASAEIPADFTKANFDENLKGVMFNEANTEQSAKPMWWDGNSIQFSPIPARLNAKKEPVPQH